MSAPYWACAQFEHRHQVLALRCLALEGFTTYLPQLKVSRRVAHGARVERQTPLFPGYLFISIMAQWHRVNRTPGVIGLIMGGECPAQIPDAVIDAIRARYPSADCSGATRCALYGGRLRDVWPFIRT